VAHELSNGRRVGVIVPDPDWSAVDGAVVLGRPADSEEFARTLYRMLRSADGHGLDVVIAVTPEERGLGAAVADRLRRAAAPRPADGADGT